MRSLLNPALHHLTDEQIENLVQAYLNKEDISALLQRYDISCAPSQLRRLLPSKLVGKNCPACGGLMVEALSKRGTSKAMPPHVHCSSCKHVDSTECRCSQCREERRRLAQVAKEKVQEKLVEIIVSSRSLAAPVELNLESISFKVAMAFLAFSRCCPINDDGLYSSINTNPVPFTPTAIYSKELIQKLLESGLIAISEHSSPESLWLNGEAVEYELYAVLWCGDIDRNQKLVEKIESLALNGDWPSHWNTEAVKVWEDIAQAECREFYDYCLESRGLFASGDSAITAMLKNILRDFAVAQCYRIIWNGARSTADFMVRERPNRTHAANYMIGACQRWADQARTEKWNVFPFRRNFDLPRTMVSFVLFDVILKIGESGFTETVHVLSTPKKM